MVSACLIVRQEEAHLARCLLSLKSAVNEIVVVDTGSTDRTIEIARDHGARVLTRTWQDDFSAARNVSLDAATGDWILVIDADEELQDGGRLPALLESATAEALQILQRNLAPPGEIAVYEDLPIVRLFRRRAAYRYEGTIHEQVSPSIRRAGGRIETADVVLLHHGYAQPQAQGVDRAARNLRALERAIATTPGDPYLQFQLGATLKALKRGDHGRAALEQAAELDQGRLAVGTRATLYLKLSQLALGRHDDEAAAVFARESLDIAPENVVALHVLAVATIGRGDAAGGRELLLALRECPQLNPAHLADIEQMIAVLKPGST